MSAAGSSSPDLPPGTVPGGRRAAWRPGRARLVVADVDGTLVGRHPHATDGVAAAVARLQAAGIRFGFATGRMRLAVEELAEQLGASGPHVLYNGAEVRLDGETVAAWPLDATQVGEIIGLCKERGWYAELYTERGFLVTATDERFAPHWDLLGHEPLGLPDELEPHETVFKATFGVLDEALVPDIEAALSALGMQPGTAGSPLTPDITYVNATSQDADKGRALRHAAEVVGVELADLVAVGDGRNDLPMLAVAGTAIAMGNADPEVREAAHLIVPEVAEDGIVHALDACITWAGDAGGASGTDEASGEGAPRR